GDPGRDVRHVRHVLKLIRLGSEQPTASARHSDPAEPGCAAARLSCGTSAVTVPDQYRPGQRKLVGRDTWTCPEAAAVSVSATACQENEPGARCHWAIIPCSVAVISRACRCGSVPPGHSPAVTPASMRAASWWRA